MSLEDLSIDEIINRFDEIPNELDEFPSHVSLNKFRGNQLSDYLKFLSKKNSFVGKNYGDKFLCIENKKLISETKKFFKKK